VRGVYVLLGDREEALVLLASVFGVVGLSLCQSRKTERALDALRDLSSPRALVVRGQGVARVGATGPKTELGRIGKALQTLDTDVTPLQTQMSRWVRVLAAAGLALCALLALAFGFFRGGWLEGLLAGLGLAMASFP
jgi:magnesium-transporting ATPase (P-type)